MQRNYTMKTSLFNLPKGSSPIDTENVKLVKRILKAATPASNVDISFNHDSEGEPFTDFYNITLDYPNVLADGKYVTTANLKPDQGKLLVDAINALTGEGDAKGSLQKLMDSVDKPGSEDMTDEGKPEGDKPEGLGGKDEGSEGKGLDLPKDKPMDQSNPTNMPRTDKPKMPFANKNSRFYRASNLERAYGMDLRDAIDLVKDVDTSSNFNDFVKKASAKILDENDKPLTHREYAELAKVAGGDRVNSPKE